MQKGIIFFVLLLFLVVNVSALCEKGQVDINSASLEELDEIVHVGKSVAQYIIDTRPFENLDELVKVKYISENYVEDIKNQGLACVSDSDNNYIDKNDEENLENPENSEEEKITENLDAENNLEISGNSVNEENFSIEKQVIFLEPKDIKTENNKENKKKINYSLFGIVFFCILIGFLYLIREKRYKKNEFN